MSRSYQTCRITLFLLLWGVVGRTDEKLDAAVRSLTSINRFAFGGVGFAGVISQGEVDLNIILSQPTPLAVTTLEKLFATGNPQAKAYALAGVKQLSQNRYVELLAVAKTSSAEGEVMRGCIINREQLQAIAKEIDNGEFHFYHQANRR